MSSNSTLYYTAVDEMFLDMVQLEDAQSEPIESKSEVEPYTFTPKRVVRIRQHNLFGHDAPEFVIYRRPKTLLNRLSTRDPETELSPHTRKDLQSLELLRLRKEKSEKEQKQKLRRVTIRI